MRLLLDTEAILRMDIDGLDSLGAKSRKLVSDPNNDLLVSAVSVTEIAIKSNVGKLAMSAELVSAIVQDLGLTLIPYKTRHANRLFGLPLHHRDPFDRMLIATALQEGIPLISSDREFRKYKGLDAIW